MNKKIIATMCGLAIVAIATVGFSAWVVGIQDTETTSDVSVAVDVVTNDTQYISAELSSKQIVIAEKEAHERIETDIIGANQNDSDGLKVDANALKFSFDKIEVVLGDDVGASKTGVKISLDTESKNEFLVTTNDLIGRSSGVSWTYLEFKPVTLTLAEHFTLDSSNEGYTIYKLNNEKLSLDDFSLSWGTYFSNGSPVKFYNGLYNEEDDVSVLLERSKNASKELNSMYTTLNSNTLVFDITLV